MFLLSVLALLFGLAAIAHAQSMPGVVIHHSPVDGDDLLAAVPTLARTRTARRTTSTTQIS
jgi:hypothetical protein